LIERHRDAVLPDHIKVFENLRRDGGAARKTKGSRPTLTAWLCRNHAYVERITRLGLDAMWRAPPPCRLFAGSRRGRLQGDCDYPPTITTNTACDAQEAASGSGADRVLTGRRHGTAAPSRDRCILFLVVNSPGNSRTIKPRLPPRTSWPGTAIELTREFHRARRIIDLRYRQAADAGDRGNSELECDGTVTFAINSIACRP